MTPILLFLLAALALLVGVGIWAVDAKRRRSSETPAAPKAPGPRAEPPTRGAEAPRSSTGQAEPEDHPGASDAQPAARQAANGVTAEPQAPAGAQAASRESEDTANAQAAPEEAQRQGQPARTALRPQDSPQPDEAPRLAALEGTRAENTSSDEASSGFRLPGAARRERRAWAERGGFDFAKANDYLPDEWAHGPATAKLAARDVVSGTTTDDAGEPHEFYFLDLGSTPVVAVRTSGESAVFFECLLQGESAQPALIEVGTYGPFRMFATEETPVRAFADSRVADALQAMPEEVTTVWNEPSWVLVALAKGARVTAAEHAVGPLCAIADAARVLPPPDGGDGFDTAHPDPTRSQPPEHPAVSSAEDEEETPGDDADPHPVARPDEPLEMPSRVQAEVFGVVDHRAVGGDAVEPIAEGASDTATDDYQGTRVVRRGDRGSSIFDDLAESFGEDPLAGGDWDGETPGPAGRR